MIAYIQEATVVNEICIQVPKHYFYNALSYINLLKIRLIAMKIDETTTYIWINDIGSRVKNLIASKLWTNIELIDKSKGKFEIVCNRNLSFLELQNLLQKHKIAAISYTSLTQTGVTKIYSDSNVVENI